MRSRWTTSALTLALLLAPASAAGDEHELRHAAVRLVKQTRTSTETYRRAAIKWEGRALEAKAAYQGEQRRHADTRMALETCAEELEAEQAKPPETPGWVWPVIGGLGGLAAAGAVALAIVAK